MQSNEEGRNNKRKLKTGTNLFNPNAMGGGDLSQQPMMATDMYPQMAYAANPYAAAGYAIPGYAYQPYVMMNQPGMYYQAVDEGIYSGGDMGPASVIQVKA